MEIEEKERKSFSFFRSFYEAAGKFKEKKKQADFLMAICDYALNGKENELSGEVGLAFTLVKPVLDKSRARAKAGTAGGLKNKKSAGESKPNQKQTESKSEANEKQTVSKTEANQKQTESKSEANESKPLYRIKDKDKDKDKEKEIGVIKTPPEVVTENVTDGGGGLSDDALEIIKLWENRFGTVSSSRATFLQDLVDDFGKDIAIYAIKEASQQGNSGWNYIKSIARNETIRREQRGTHRDSNGTGETQISDPYLQQLHEQAKRNGNVV